MGSPAIDAGDNGQWQALPDATDLLGQPRVNARHGIVDLGCFESDLPNRTILLVQ